MAVVLFCRCFDDVIPERRIRRHLTEQATFNLAANLEAGTIALIAAAMAAVYSVIAGWQWVTMNRQLKAMQDTAEITRQSMQLTEQSIRELHRPWVRLSKLYTGRPWHRSTGGAIEIEIANAGQRAARNLCIRAAHCIAPWRGPLPDLQPLHEEEIARFPSLPPGAITDFTIWVAGPRYESRWPIADDKLTLHLAVSVAYEDTMAGPGLSMRYCIRHNRHAADGAELEPCREHADLG